ncbi:hypothetical protein F5883DRAFT_646850 [Diaporthe sp. PMI_573]|nr:hypothetical protein F5883DRAFT_646850 [Diaporthaceae sp. PMI_573]
MADLVAQCRLIFRDNPSVDLSRIFVAGKALVQRGLSQPAFLALITDVEMDTLYNFRGEFSFWPGTGVIRLWERHIRLYIASGNHFPVSGAGIFTEAGRESPPYLWTLRLDENTCIRTPSFQTADGELAVTLMLAGTSRTWTFANPHDRALELRVIARRNVGVSPQLGVSPHLCVSGGHDSIALAMAVLSGDIDHVRALVRIGVGMSGQHRWVLYHACLQGLDMVQELLACHQ